MLHIISLAHLAIIAARGWAANSINARVRLQAKLEEAENKIQLLKEELRIKDSRFARVASKNRPRFLPEERMEILQLRAAQGWTKAETAKRFGICENTITSWSKRLDDSSGFLSLGKCPVNKFPEFISFIAKRMKILNPIFCKKRIADLLCRAGLHIATSTIGRMLKSKQNPVGGSDSDILIEEKPEKSKPQIKAEYPNHIWHVDLTVVPTTGLWTSWLSNTLFQCWPFAYYVAAVIDHYTRRVIGFAIFKKNPSSLEVQNFLELAIAKEGQNPRYIISDKGSQFWCESYKKWAKDSDIKLRFGAIGQHGSIAVI